MPSTCLFVRICALMLALASLVATPCHADPTTATSDGAEGVFGEASTGQGQADNRTGAMKWSYPFGLPTARGRPQPQLALVYNSSSRDREAGYGWGLDLPVIERKPLSGYPCSRADGTPTACGTQSLNALAEERYSYSGQPLVYLCTLPAPPAAIPPACGDKKQPAWALAGGWRYFRLQVEGQFARFYLAPDRRHWRVQLKGGGLLELGEPPDTTSRGLERDAQNANAILRWRLVRHSDAVHSEGGKPLNYVEYRWRPLGKRGLLFLTDIFDTPRSTHHTDDADFAHHTQLTWAPPDFPQTHYADPFRATPDLRLVRVATASMPWTGIGRREVIRTYTLRYQPVQGPTTTVPLSQVFYPWHHSFLAEIQMQGKCGRLEDERGDLPPTGECRGSLTPPTRFEYEDGWPAFGIAATTKVEGGPPNAVQQDQVLPYLSTVGLVDFNRDGLPDLVQGWKPSLKCSGPECEEAWPMIGYLNRGTGLYVELEHQCFDAGRLADTTGLAHYGRNLDGFFTSRGGATLVGSWSEGVLAWSNAGYAPYRARPLLPAYDLQLLTLADASEIPATGNGVLIVARIGPAHYVRIFGSDGKRVVDGRAVEFLPEQTLAEIDDAYGAVPLPPDRKQALSERILNGFDYYRPFEPGSGCDIDSFTAASFKPGWKWEKTQSSIDWAKPPVAEVPLGQPGGGHGPYGNLPRWFSDIDGDGLLDRFESTGVQAFDFETAYVEFTQRYAAGAPLFGGGSGPAQIPFVFDPNQLPHSLAPSYAGSQSGTRYWYVDINGDGLSDLVTYNVGDFSGVPQVRPGNGRGEFACIDLLQPWPCQEPSTQISRLYGVEVPGPIKPWPFNDETFFHDITGDGLADIVRYDMATGEVRVWVNQDGHTFACAIPSCIAGKVLNVHAAERGLSGAAAWDIGEHRVTFADMNGDEVDDIVILARPGAYVGVFMKKYVMDGGRGFGPRPGLLTRIHNGYGATTDIQYRSIAELDLAARSDAATAWRTHVPAVDAVVTQITTQDSYHAGGNLSATAIGAPYIFKRTAQFLYQDPAWDRWSRSFVGFRKVVAHYGNDAATTSTTYWYGPCQNNRLNARLPSNPNFPLCPDGSDDDEFKSLAGRVLRIDRGNEMIDYFRREAVGTPSLLWSRLYRYSNDILFRTPERKVSFAYASQVDTYLYDDGQPTVPGDVGPGFAGSGGDRVAEAPHQKALRKHLRSGQEIDARGTLRRVFEYGAIRDEDSAPDTADDAAVVTLYSERDSTGANDAALALPCTEDWVCQATYTSLWLLGPNGSPLDKLLRKRRLSYTATHDIETVANWLDEAALPLDRKHPSGAAATVTTAPGQALARGWHVALNAAYDAFGNLAKTWTTQSAGGSPARCALFERDREYAQFVEFTHKYVDGCGGQAHVVQTVFDRGFEQVTDVREASGSLSQVHFDPLGRIQEILLPDPTAPPGAAPVLAESFAYSDQAPVSHVERRLVVGPGVINRAVTLLNGLGEPVAELNQGDSTEWVLSRWVETDTAGRPTLMRRQWTTTSDPVTSAINGTSFAVPFDDALVELQYDGFGRRVSIKEAVLGATQEIQRTAYSPLAMEIRDAEQLAAGGVHTNASQRIEFDGRGRRVLSRFRMTNPVPDDIVTRVEYAPTGEILKVSRSHAGGLYQRNMIYDTLGRLVRNNEPNTGNNWRYAWDDSGRLVGTSDARGCGENFHYDGLDRLVGEDYAPCFASHTAYSEPDLATGAGLEVVYRYDTYEPGQIQQEPGFADDAQTAIGRLASISDRGGHTRFSYDARGRVRRIARQVATPDSASADSFASHWFTSRRDYDLGDRLTRRTTGADVDELLVGGTSEERYAYSPRGNLASIDTSYGTLVKSMTFDAHNAPTRIEFGDARAATLRSVYDPRRRLSVYQLIAPAVGGGPPIGYFDYRLSDYDAVGNPLVIEDARIAWTVLPPEAAPVAKRTVEYDDLYRVTRVTNAYKTFDGTAPWVSPFAAETAAANGSPLPLRSLPKRVAQQQFRYDGLGNITDSTDDQSAFFDRSLGAALKYGMPAEGPNQLRSADGVSIHYDASGNVVELKVERTGSCPTSSGSTCAQWFTYDWDEVGQLVRTRRWDFSGNELPPTGPIGVTIPTWDLSYAYSQGRRVRKSASGVGGGVQHTLELFDTLRIDNAAFDAVSGDYRVRPANIRAYLAGIAQAYWDASGTLPHQPGTSGVVMHLVVGDHLGSSAVVINHATSDLVERTTYQPYGAIESDHRPANWKAFRETYKFTGKEEDIETGSVYFGARYYQPYLGRFLSPDPLTVHGFAGDLNPYAYVAGRVLTHVDRRGLCGGGSYPIEGGMVSYSYDCDNQSRAEDQVARAEARVENARIRQPTSFVRDRRPDAGPSLVPTPPQSEEVDEWDSAAASSAGGLVSPRTSRATNSELIANLHPALAPQIRAAARQDLFLKLAPLVLFFIPGGQAEGALVDGEVALSTETAALGDVAWGARLKPAAIESTVTPSLTMSDGYALGNDLGQVGQTLSLGKYPGNVQFVRATPGTYTVDRPWGWTPNYNAGAVRGHLDAGGPIHLTSETFTGTYKLEVEQILNSMFQ